MADTIRWGVIGAGDVLERKSGIPLQETPGSTVVAVMRRDADKAEAYARRHNVPRWTTDADDILNAPDINAVYVATPHYLLSEYSVKAAQAGKMVLVEKPAGVNTAEAQAAVDAAKSAGVPLAVAYYRRYWPDIVTMRELLASNAIGPVTHVRVQLSDYFGGDPSRPWIVNLRESGGGSLSNAGSHWIDLLRYLMGEIAEVYGYVSSKAAGWEVEDTAALVMKTVNDVPVIFSASWNGSSVNDFDIIGREGRILASPLSEGRLTLFRRGHDPEVFERPRSGPAHQEFIQALIPALRDGGPMPVSGEDAVAAWKIMDAGYESSRTGQPVRLV
jgi:predicted dehydrogenase